VPALACHVTPAGRANEQAARVTFAGVVGSSRPQHRATRPRVPAFSFAGVHAWVRRRGSGQAGRQASCRCPAPPRHGLWRRHLLMPCHRALSWPGDVLFVHCLSRSSKGSPVPAVRRVHPDGEQEPKKPSPEMLPREHTSP
jgi:hypothetical protein